MTEPIPCSKCGGIHAPDIKCEISEIDQTDELSEDTIDNLLSGKIDIEQIEGKYHKEIALKIIEAGEGWYVAENLDKFTSIDHNQTALKLIETGPSWSVAKNLDKFTGLDKEIALKLIEAGSGWSLARNLDKFTGLDNEIVLKIIEAGSGDCVAQNLDKFTGLDHKEIALKLIKTGSGWSVAQNLDKFTGIDHKQIVLKLIEAGSGESVAENLDKFTSIDHNQTALKLIEAGSGESVAQNLDKFIGLDHKQIVLKFIEVGLGSDVAENLDKFIGLDHKQTALKLIEAGSGESVAQNLDKFTGLDNKKIQETLHQHTDYVIAQAGIALKVKTYKNLLEFAEVEEDALDFLKKTNRQWNLNKEEYEIQNFLKTPEAIIAKEGGQDLANLDYEGFFLLMKNNQEMVDWQDEQNISGPFERGANIFGYKQMFEYINRSGLSRHDALHAFDKIIGLFQASGLSAEQFYGQILLQVNKDGAGYDTGTAHHELNSLADIINLDVEGILVEAKEFDEIDKLQNLLQEIKSSRDVFASWRNLKKFDEITKLLGQKEILNQLQELKKEESQQALYKYIETLAFHPNINMLKVFEFWRNPDDFLEINDTHTSAEVHNRKKPSNYTNIPNLDLTGENLRDALVNGDMDKLQAFRPLEIEYEVPDNLKNLEANKKEYNLLTRVKDALGSYREKIEGKANSPKKLFSEVNKLFKKKGLHLMDFLGGILELDSETEAEVLSLIHDPTIGMARAEKTIKYRAKVNLKSDPNGVVAGNDTACCMPFGSGKNNVYTFNPVCSLFTLQRQNNDGTWRTVAQSVLTKDKNIGKLISDVKSQLESQGKMENVLPEDVLKQAQFTLACDNVEVAPAVKGHRLTEAQIELIYRDFMSEYLSRYAKEENLDPKQVVIGKGYSDSLTHLPEIPNTYAPSAPVGYSDKLHESVYQLIPKKSTALEKKVVAPSLSENEEELKTEQKNVSYLTFEDTLPVAYIEGKAYHDNESLIQYLHNMENGLIAKDINNASKDRPNMSLKYTDDSGSVRGYILAYEGRLGEEDELPIIYISDLASDLKVKGVGGSLIMAFLEQYKANYIDNPDRYVDSKPIPLYAEAREKTSYAIMKAKLPEYAKNIGLNLEVEELGQYEQGDDIMHKVMIRVV